MGLGDEIMTTGFARLAKDAHPDAQIIIGNKEKNLIYDHLIFKNNPNITKEKDIKLSMKTVWIETYPQKRPYIKRWDENKIYWNNNFRTVRGDLFFDNFEIKKADEIIKDIQKKKNMNKKIIFIEPSRKIKEYNKNNLDNTLMGEPNKCWVYDRWQEVIYKLRDKCIFIQSLHKDSKKLEGVYGFKSDFRIACSVMSLCDLFLGWEGGFSHAAAALKKKGVVLFGGWIHPNLTGYDDHLNIYCDIKGSPCGNKNYCEHCEKCRKLITVDQVVGRLNQII